MIIAVLRLFPARAQRRQLLSILRGIQGPTRAQPHCLACQVYEEHGYDDAVLYLETWDSEPEFHRHARSNLYRQVLEAIELSQRKPEIHFHLVEQTRGLDLLEELSARRNIGATPSQDSKPKPSDQAGG